MRADYYRASAPSLLKGLSSLGRRRFKTPFAVMHQTPSCQRKLASKRLLGKPPS
jgi:hypothetical protein